MGVFDGKGKYVSLKMFSTKNVFLEIFCEKISGFLTYLVAEGGGEA